VKKRFILFGFGFILGIIIIIVRYGDKSDTLFAWAPEGRVLKRLRMTEKIISDSLQCVLDCNDFKKENWKQLYANGDVNFARARNKPNPIYSVSLNLDSLNAYTLTFETNDSTSVLIAIKAPKLDCN
jgi:hypothetical protein